MVMHDHLRQLSKVWASPGNRSAKAAGVLRAVWWFTSKRFRKQPLRRTVFTDRRFYCYPDGFVSNSVMLFGEWHEYDALHFIDAWLRPEDYFLDVGANVGLYSLLASRHVGSSIVCVEPGKTQLDRLAENLRDNSCNALILPYCVSDEPGISHMSSGDAVSHVSADTLQGEAVETVRLDDVVPDRTYALMKLDVEGFELKALRGARSLISSGRLPAILFELNGSSTRYGVSESDVPRLLREHGYTLGMYRHDEQVFDTTASLWGDVLALSEQGMEMLKRRLPNLRVVGTGPGAATGPAS
ncbi:MAG: FkbM family methyltransferase [Pirellula sp.]